MNATQFARKRGRIEHQAGKSYSWRVRAMRQLVNEACATLAMVEGKVVGWLLPNGETVCIKQRYRDEGSALATLVQIERTEGIRPKRPVRAYACRYCLGWHLTSQARPAVTCHETT